MGWAAWCDCGPFFDLSFRLLSSNTELDSGVVIGVEGVFSLKRSDEMLEVVCRGALENGGHAEQRWYPQSLQAIQSDAEGDGGDGDDPGDADPQDEPRQGVADVLL